MQWRLFPLWASIVHAPPHYTNSQNSMISFWVCWSLSKQIFPILSPAWNSTTGITILWVLLSPNTNLRLPGTFFVAVQKKRKCTVWFVKLKKGLPSSRFGDEVSNPYFCHFYFDVSGHCIFTFVNGLRRWRPRGRVFITCLFAGEFCQKSSELVVFSVSDLFLTHPPPPLHQTKFRVSLGMWPSFFE